MKKTFPCGHKGQGKYCHRCKAAEVLEKKPAISAPEGEKTRQETIARLKAVPQRGLLSSTSTPAP